MMYIPHRTAIQMFNKSMKYMKYCITKSERLNAYVTCLT